MVFLFENLLKAIRRSLQLKVLFPIACSLHCVDRPHFQKKANRGKTGDNSETLGGTITTVDDTTPGDEITERKHKMVGIGVLSSVLVWYVVVRNFKIANTRLS